MYVLETNAAHTITYYTNEITRPDETITSYPSVVTKIWARQGDAWRVVHIHESSAQPAAPSDGSVRPMLGASMLNFLRGHTDRIHDDDYVTVLYHWGRGFVRQGKWKLANLDPPFSEAEMELFNLETDPGETTNLAQKEPEVFASMLELWRTTRIELGIVLEDEL